MVYQKTARRPPEDCQKTARDQQKTTRRPAEDCQKTTRRLSADCQKTTRRPPEDYQKTTRRVPLALAVFWQSSNTMIQGNFYKRLHFYMDSCAISPMASLFVKYTENKTSIFQIQLEFWVNMTLCFRLMYPPPGKVGFCPSCNFSNIFPLKWLRMTQNGQFSLIHNFSNLSPPKWLRLTWNVQFCLIRNFSNLFPPKRNDQNLQKCKYLSRISTVLHKTFRTGLIFPSRSK